MKRSICTRCHRPQPVTCICPALPKSSIQLKKCKVIVLQHPHEQKRKNRSLPLVELCFQQSIQNENENNDNERRHESDNNNNYTTTATNNMQQDKDFYCIVARRLGDQVDSSLMNMIHDPNYYFLLFFPTDDAIPLQTALKNINEEQHNKGDSKNNGNDEEPKKIILFFIDATWKFAKEMLQSCHEYHTLPSHITYVKFTKDDFSTSFQPKRFDIRTPPSDSHLSTAECIAHALRIVEGSNNDNDDDGDNDNVFDVLMKPLDLMVDQWHSFFDEKKCNNI